MDIKFENLRENMDRIEESNPFMHIATVSLNTVLRTPHSATVKFATDDSLQKVYWLSSAGRIHAQHIESFNRKGLDAPISASMNLPNRHSQPYSGFSFEGSARKLDDKSEIEEALGILVTKNILLQRELGDFRMRSEYHDRFNKAAYVGKVKEWTFFDELREFFDQKFVWNPENSPSIN